MDQTTLYIVRHAESESNVKEIVNGLEDYPLTKNGEAQAQAIGKELNHINFDAVFSSDLMRAKRTAEIIVLEKKLAVKTTEALRERNFGKFSGKPIKELFELFDSWKTLSYSELIKQRPADDAESDEEIIARLITFLREIAVAYQGKNVLITTHGGIIYNFLAHLGVINHKKLVIIENTALVVVESDGIDFNVLEKKGVTINDES